MAKWGEFDFSELKSFATNLKAMHKVMPAFIDGCVKELAGRLLAKVIPRTPVGEYNGNWVEFTTSSGEHVKFQTKNTRHGGALRQGWTIGQLYYEGNSVSVEVINPVEYAAYVEHGHRTANHKGWVEGRFMLKISEEELRRELPGIINKRLEKLFNDFLG